MAVSQLTAAAANNAEGGKWILVSKSGMGWFDWLKRLFAFGTRMAPLDVMPNPTSASRSGGTQYTANAAASEFGEIFIGVVEIGPEGTRVTAGSYAKNANHLTLSKQNLGPLHIGQRRFGFIRNRRGITIGPSSTGAIPKTEEIPTICAALGERGYLTPGGLHLVVAEARNGEQHAYNLLTGEAIV